MNMSQRTAIQALFAMGLSTLATAQSGNDPLARAPLHSLRQTSLYCLHLAVRPALNPRNESACAAVNATLVQRAFGGSAADLLTWQRSMPAITFAGAHPAAWKTLALARSPMQAVAHARPTP